MRAVRLTAIQSLEVAEVREPSAGPGEAVVSLRAAALNHRDVWIKAGQYAGLKFPCVPGSDGAGVVTSVGPEVDRSWLGREVIINPSFGWGSSERTQGAGFSILGLPRDGTFAERVAVPAVQLTARPPHLSWTEAAALPLGGLTAWRTLMTRARMEPVDKVLLSGIGGGVALFALQFAVASGAAVWVTSGSPEKIERAGSLGARGGFLYTQSGWAAEALKAAGPFDVIIDSAGGDGLNDLLDLAAPGGRIAFFGATRGNPSSVALRKIFWRQLSLLGSSMGSPADWSAMIAFACAHAIKPVVGALFPLSRAAEAFQLMERGGQFGKIVLEISR
jgi:NADPH:quinone reductase-like Zn-dependent oxidoreductase